MLGFYLIWYGVVRIIMEPLRNSEFNMGTNGMWSVWNSLIYIILGALLLGAFQLLAYWEKKKGLPNQEKVYSFFYLVLEAAFSGIGAWFVGDGIRKCNGPYRSAYLFVLVLGLALIALNGALFYFSLKKFLANGSKPNEKGPSETVGEKEKITENKGE
ncbi:MAG TPA: hypothetical protein DEA63_05470 [Firmicutes bacterium]|nr:hypothetical protein [Bacillota bacterium]